MADPNKVADAAQRNTMPTYSGYWGTSEPGRGITDYQDMSPEMFHRATNYATADYSGGNFAPSVGAAQAAYKYSQSPTVAGATTGAPQDELQQFLASLTTPPDQAPFAPTTTNAGFSGGFGGGIRASLDAELKNQLATIQGLYDTRKKALDSGKTDSIAAIDEAIASHTQAIKAVQTSYATQAAGVDASLAKLYSDTLGRVQESKVGLTERLAKMGIDPNQFLAGTANNESDLADQQNRQQGHSQRLAELQQQSLSTREALGETLRAGGTSALNQNYANLTGQLDLERFRQESEAQASYQAGIRQLEMQQAAARASASRGGGGGGGGGGDSLAERKFAHTQEQDYIKTFGDGWNFEDSLLKPGSPAHVVATQSKDLQEAQEVAFGMVQQGLLSDHQYTSILGNLGTNWGSARRQAMGLPIRDQRSWISDLSKRHRKAKADEKAGVKGAFYGYVRG